MKMSSDLAWNMSCEAEIRMGRNRLKSMIGNRINAITKHSWDEHSKAIRWKQAIALS